MLQSVTVQSSTKVAETTSADLPVARVDASFDLIGFVQAAAAGQSADGAAATAPADPLAAAKPIDPLTALMNIGQLAEKGLKTSSFAEAVTADQGVKIHVFPTPDGATVDTIRDLPMVTAADLEHAVSLLPASAEKDMVLALIHDPKTIAAAMQAAGLFNPTQMQVAGQDIGTQTLLPQDVAAVPDEEQSVPDGMSLDQQSDAPVTVQSQAPQPVDSGVTDPAVLAAQQALMIQPVILPQVQPVAAPEQMVEAEPVLPPEITSGPWGTYQSPVMPDQRFVRFIMPKSEQTDMVSATALFGIDVPDGAAFAPLVSEGDGPSEMATLAETAMAGSDLVIGQTISGDAGLSLSDKLAALMPAGSQRADMAQGLSSQSTDMASPLLADTASASVAPSAASLFSSIFAKHGISQSADDMPVLAGSSSPDTALSTSAPAAGFDTTPVLAALSGLAPQAFVPPQPFQQGSLEEGSGDAVRNSLLKTLGGLKTAPATGGLASQLVNSRQILDLAAEEGLTIGQAATATLPHFSEQNSDPFAAASSLNGGFAPVAKNNAFASSGDLGLGSTGGNDLVSNGQGQAGGQSGARQDGQSSSQQQSARAREEAAFVAAATGNDDVIRAAAKNDEGFSSLATAHQTSLANDGAGLDAPTFSTASMAQSTPVASVSGSALGARETLKGVTYALAGQPSNGAGSAVAAEMRFMSLGQQVMAALKQNSQEIELRLNPAQLGNVVLKLQVEGQKLSISAKTESQLSDEALSAGEDGLRASLAAHGYQLDKFDVSHQDERRKSNRPEAERSEGTERTSDNPFSFDLIA